MYKRQEYGLPDDLLNHTDVLIWWAHVAHDRIPVSYTHLKKLCKLNAEIA